MGAEPEWLVALRTLNGDCTLVAGYASSSSKSRKTNPRPAGRIMELQPRQAESRFGIEDPIVSNVEVQPVAAGLSSGTEVINGCDRARCEQDSTKPGTGSRDSKSMTRWLAPRGQISWVPALESFDATPWWELRDQACSLRDGVCPDPQPGGEIKGIRMNTYCCMGLG